MKINEQKNVDKHGENVYNIIKETYKCKNKKIDKSDMNVCWRKTNGN